MLEPLRRIVREALTPLEFDRGEASEPLRIATLPADHPASGIDSVELSRRAPEAPSAPFVEPTAPSDHPARQLRLAAGELRIDASGSYRLEA